MSLPPEPIDGRKLRYAGRRAELLQAVSAYIQANGVGELAMRPMAEAVGVSHATLLNHFGTKEALITEVIDGFSKRSLAQGVPTEELVRDARGHIDIADAVGAWWRQFSSPRDVPAIRAAQEVLGQAMLHPERYEQFVQQYMYDWLAVLRVLVRKAGAPGDKVEALATMVLAQVRGFQADLAATGDHDRVNAAADIFIAALRGLQAGWNAG